MTYNVFGGTLNLTQPSGSVWWSLRPRSRWSSCSRPREGTKPSGQGQDFQKNASRHLEPKLSNFKATPLYECEWSSYGVHRQVHEL